MIIKVPGLIIPNMTRAEAMPKQAQRNVPIAKPRGKPIDIEAGVERVLTRFPRIMARLGE